MSFLSPFSTSASARSYSSSSMGSANSRGTNNASQLKPSKRICVIGAGSSGLAALKVIKETAQYKSGQWDVVAFEARNDVGGIWLPAPPTVGTDPPLTPLYDSLTTNLPHPVMTYPGEPFPPSTHLYPKAHAILEYLRSHAQKFDLTPHIQLNTSVSDVRWTGTSWTVKVVSTKGEESVHSFDHIIVANGHYHVPFYPHSTLPGLSHWQSTHPGRISHSAWYRNPASLGDIGRTVLIVGGGPSGRDIANELAHADASRTIIHADPSFSAESGQLPNLVRRGRVTRLSEDGTHAAYFTSGAPISSISYVLLATGYIFSFPFLTSSTPIRDGEMPPPSPPLPTELFNSQHHLYPLARDMFPLTDAFPPDKLVFVGLPIRVVPFALEEAQVRAAVAVFANPSLLNVEEEKKLILARYAFLRDEALSSPSRPPSDDALALHIARAWFRYREHDQFTYRESLLSLAGLPDPKNKVREWEIEFYDQKELLRVIWEELEESGEAEKWVRGVGEGKGEDGKGGTEEAEREWVELMRRLIKERGGGIEERKLRDAAEGAGTL